MKQGNVDHATIFFNKIYEHTIEVNRRENHSKMKKKMIRIISAGKRRARVSKGGIEF